MSFLHLGVACAVRDSEGRILLSKRGDLDVWNLPTGRLDRHELLTEAALREVYEETGIRAEITRLVGLYHYHGWGRMNMLFEARYTGGILQQKTFESRENRFFAPDDLPKNNISEQMVYDVLNHIQTPLRVISMSNLELYKTKMRLGWRWVKNLLQGHLEPFYPYFNISACYEPCEFDGYLADVDGKYPIWKEFNLQATETLTGITHDLEQNIFIFRFGKNLTGIIQYPHEGEGE